MILKRYSLLICCFILALALSVDADEGDKTSVQASSLEQSDSSSTLFKLEKKNQSTRAQVRGIATDRESTGNETGSFGLEALFGQLFFPEAEQYKGYYLMTGKVESDSRQRFNATLAYFVPIIGGETKLTYRLLHAEIRDNLPITGEFEEYALEQGLGLYYKKRYELPLKELSFDYAYTHLGDQSVLQGPFTFDSANVWERADVITGFGDIDTHHAPVEASQIFAQDTRRGIFVSRD